MPALRALPHQGHPSWQFIEPLMLMLYGGDSGGDEALRGWLRLTLAAESHQRLDSQTDALSGQEAGIHPVGGCYPDRGGEAGSQDDL